MVRLGRNRHEQETSNTVRIGVSSSQGLLSLEVVSKHLEYGRKT